MRQALSRFVVALLCTGGALAPAAAQTAYDGSWNVQIVTQTGACGGPYRIAVAVSRGTIRYGGADESAPQVGTVTAAGMINGQIRSGGMEVTVKGQLFKAAGTGQWTLAREGAACAGRWTAEKAAPGL